MIRLYNSPRKLHFDKNASTNTCSENGVATERHADDEKKRERKTFYENGNKRTRISKTIKYHDRKQITINEIKLLRVYASECV